MKRRLADDTGASLIIALIFIVVVAVVMGAILTLTDANLRNTTALRDRAGKDYGADGAAKIAIKQLENDHYLGGDCPALNVQAGYAVQCEVDEGNSSMGDINTVNRQATALLALAPAGQGLYFNIQGNPATQSIKVKGGLFSHSDFAVDHGWLDSLGPVTARGDCLLITAQARLTAPKQDCKIGTVANKLGKDPNYSVPAVTGDATVQPCTKTKKTPYVVTPGILDATDMIALNKLTSNHADCQDVVIWMKPGAYQFNAVWEIKSGKVVGGGSDTPPDTVDPNKQGYCPAPIPLEGQEAAWTPPAAGLGVTITFGPAAQLSMVPTPSKITPSMELCGNYEKNKPPIVFYGRTAAPETLAIKTDPNSDFRLYVQGTTYLPTSVIDLQLKKDVLPFFRSGITSYRFRVDGLGNASSVEPLVETPDAEGTSNSGMVWLEVRSTADNTVRLRAKVYFYMAKQTEDEPPLPIDPPRYASKIVSWATQR